VIKLSLSACDSSTVGSNIAVQDLPFSARFDFPKTRFTKNTKRAEAKFARSYSFACRNPKAQSTSKTRLKPKKNTTPHVEGVCNEKVIKS
jgi:hypothetical protein